MFRSTGILGKLWPRPSLGRKESGSPKRGQAENVRKCPILSDLRRFCPIFAEGFADPGKQSADFVQFRADFVRFGVFANQLDKIHTFHFCLQPPYLQNAEKNPSDWHCSLAPFGFRGGLPGDACSLPPPERLSFRIIWLWPSEILGIGKRGLLEKGSFQEGPFSEPIFGKGMRRSTSQ